MSHPIAPDLTIWGKWGDGEDGAYSLLAHLLDSAAVAQLLFDIWMPPNLIAQLDSRLASCAYSAEQVVVTAAGLHDLGKINPVFQGQLLGAHPEAFAGQTEALRRGGYWMPADELRPTTGRENEFIRRHEVASTVFLRDHPEDDPTTFGCVVGGHHGKWRTFGKLEWDPDVYPVACQFFERLTSEGMWSDQVEAHRAQLLELLGQAACDTRVSFDRATVPLLTSAVCLADWIASSETSIADGQSKLHVLADDPRMFQRLRREFLTDHVRSVLGTPRKPVGSFHEVFGFEPSRPVQEALVGKNPPGLTVVMVPMGEGKTEAALGHWMESASEGQGIYFALPTMATADAMFTRIQDFFASTEDPVSGTITHGRAVLNAFYQPPSEDVKIRSTGESTGGLTPQDWFTGPHRALLSPVAVGTVDQLLSGVLRHKYNFLRLLGAATKTVVLDEVHTYDPYMSELLSGFLEWAGWLHIDVVILSATLPARRLNEYVAAYRKGQGVARQEDLVPSYPSVVRVVDGEMRSLDLSARSSGREATLDLKWVPTDDARQSWMIAAETVIELAKSYPEAKIGVIMNTVGGAQDATVHLKDAGLNPALLHSRMPAFERSNRTEAAIAEFGKDSTCGASILVATQVVEASMDLDFDILVTQVCPATSLLQRSGRVWRHDLSEPHRTRTRPAELDGPCIAVVYPEPFPVDVKVLLPYLGAEVKKTLDALGDATTDHINIPGDVQALVDAADVSLSDIMAMGSMAEDAVIIEMARRGQGRSVRIPGPGELSGRRGLSYLEQFTEGDLGNAERATRLTEQDSVTVLPMARDNRLAWSGDLPTRPDRAQVLELLGYTIPVSGSLATLIWDETNSSNSAFSTGNFEHRLLSDIVGIALEKTDLIEVDELLGMRKK